MEQLSTQYPVADTLGPFRDYFLHPNFTGLTKPAFFRGSPLGNVETEMVLADLVIAAAKDGEWVGYDSGWSAKDLEDLKAGHIASHFEVGFSYALRNKLLDVEVVDDKVYVFPTEDSVKFVKERILSYRRQHEKNI